MPSSARIRPMPRRAARPGLGVGPETLLQRSAASATLRRRSGDDRRKRPSSGMLAERGRAAAGIASAHSSVASLDATALAIKFSTVFALRPSCSSSPQPGEPPVGLSSLIESDGTAAAQTCDCRFLLAFKALLRRPVHVYLGYS
eukprot:7032758-Prymnesium_polylepis.1